MSRDGEFLVSFGVGSETSLAVAILETQVGVPTSSSESVPVSSAVPDRVPPRGPGTSVDSDNTLLRGNQGSLAPSFPVSESADSATSTPGGSHRRSSSAARGPDRHSSTASVCPLEDVLSQRSPDLDCMDKLSRQVSASPRAGRKHSASPLGRSSRRDIRALSRATPPGMIRGELTGALYEDPLASDRFPRKTSSSAARSRQDDVPTLRPPNKSAAPSRSSRVKEQSRGVSQRQDCSPPRRVEVDSTQDIW